MKKIITALSLHLACLVALIATIGSVSGTKSNEGTEKFTGELERNVTIRILENDTAVKQGYLKRLLDAFNEKYAEYGITAVDANMDEYSDLEKDGPFGYGPDVVYQANDVIMRYVSGKHVMPLPIQKLECYDKISERGWNAYSSKISNSGGSQSYHFGVPVNIQGPVLYYRKDLLPENWKTEWDSDRNGVPDMLESWSVMYRYSNEIKRNNPGKYGYMRSFFEPYFSIGYLYSYGAYSFGNDNTDPSDIGYSKGESYKGASVIRQLASSMNEWCIDDTITVNAYSNLAKGTYFATMTTPDVYTLFVDEMLGAGYSPEYIAENLVATYIPMLPVSGDLTDESGERIPSKMMGGINGYAISSYTKYPNACLAFVDFATSYKMIELRNELLGIAPARSDVAQAAGGLSSVINSNMEAGNIVVMPSIKEVGQIWTPLKTLFVDIAKDPFRTKEYKYDTLEKIKVALQKVDQQIYDAIFTLQ